MSLRRLRDPLYLKGHWLLNGHAQDVSRHGNHGTWAGTEAYAAGPFGRSVGVFNSTTSEVGDLTRPVIMTQPFSFTIWVRPTASELNQTIIHVGGVGNGALFLEAAGSVWAINVRGSGADSSVHSVDVGIWQHLVYVYDGANWTLYKNALADVDFSARDAAGTLDNMWIGSFNSGNYWFGGDITNVRAYNVELSADEVTALYRYENGGKI